MSNDGYGEPQYPAEPYPKPPLIPPSQRGIFAALGVIVVAGLVVLVMAIAGVFSSDSTAGNTPRKAVEDALYASKRQNLDDLKTVVCRRDLSNPELGDVVGDDHAESYSIGRVTQTGDRASVDVRVTTAKRTSSASLPVLREDGSWKVCFSEIDDPSGPSGSDTTPPPSSDSFSPSSPDPSLSLSTPSINFCASATDAVTTAKYFASFVGLDLTTQAASCVYQDRISKSDVEALTGDIYSPDQVVSSGNTFSFRAATGSSTLYVTVEKQSDGKYYVVAARKS